MSNKVLFFISVVCLSWSCTSGLYFFLKESGSKCFREDVPEDTMIVGKYRVEIHDKLQRKYVPTPSGFGMHVEVFDPDQKVVLSRIYAAEGRFVFTSVKMGDHFICLQSNSTTWFGGSELKVHLEFLIGEKTNDYHEIARRDKLTELQVRIRQLLDQTEQIKKEQEYQRMRETRFRETSESVNIRVFMWAVVQVIVLLVASLGQIFHLKRFFIAKKLV